MSNQFKDMEDTVNLDAQAQAEAVGDAQTLESIAKCLGWQDHRVIMAALVIVQLSEHLFEEKENKN